LSVVTTRTLQRKTLQFREKRCNFQKARAGEVLYVCRQRIKRPRSLSVTDAAVLRTSMREEFPMKIIASSRFVFRLGLISVSRML
jgi:hypothetical protein